VVWVGNVAERGLGFQARRTEPPLAQLNKVILSCTKHTFDSPFDLAFLHNRLIRYGFGSALAIIFETIHSGDKVPVKQAVSKFEYRPGSIIPAAVPRLPNRNVKNRVISPPVSRAIQKMNQILGSPIRLYNHFVKPLASESR